MCVARHDTISGVTGSESRSTGIGRFIRQHVVPAGMTVTEAARRLGVGRPALSNLLNGRAALSQEMALRLEGTFGADRAKLLELQAASDRDRRSVEDRAVAVGTYAPSFLTIKARQIVDWAAGNIRAREHLPVLLRRLIHATGRELRHVDFPGYDNAQRHGWDGWIEADAATPWVPEGRSGWEFGVDQRPGAKADRDYQARLKTISPAERAECAFVFVTPR
ncbi:MAG: HigA family addiction module antidote protein, partial [Acidobacteria bacterium]|nr:HigA family addiction module antidote protein [Acidobacteriota bacterium]